MPHSKAALEILPGESPVKDMDKPPICIRCNVAMELRRAGRGKRAGLRFWGCPNYWKEPPDKCTFTIDISCDGTWTSPTTSPTEKLLQSVPKEEIREELTTSTKLNVVIRHGKTTKELTLTPLSLFLFVDDDEYDVVSIRVANTNQIVTLHELEELQY